MLQVACNHCDRHGRLTTSRLVKEHGPELPIPELRQIIASDCARMIAGQMHDVCGVHFPGLGGLLQVSQHPADHVCPPRAVTKI